MGKLLTGQDGLGPVKALKSLETLQQGWGCDRSQAALAAPKEPTESVECLLAQARGGTTMPTLQACRLQQFIGGQVSSLVLKGLVCAAENSKPIPLLPAGPLPARTSGSCSSAPQPSAGSQRLPNASSHHTRRLKPPRPGAGEAPDNSNLADPAPQRDGRASGPLVLQ